MTWVAWLRCISFASIISFVVIWSLVAASGLVREDFLPSPSKLVSSFMAMLQEGYGGSPLWKHVGMSVMRAVSGFLVAVVLGVPIGILIGRHEVLGAIVAPIIGFLRPIPPIAFVTLFVFYFGIGEGSKIGLIFMAAFWYVVLNCADGVRSVPQMLIRAGQSMGLNSQQLFFRVIIPAAMPAIMTALRAASSISWTQWPESLTLELVPLLGTSHVVVLGEAHLRQILRAYADYYNRARTHLALSKDAPSAVLSRRLDRSWPSHSSVDFITDTPGWLKW